MEEQLINEQENRHKYHKKIITIAIVLGILIVAGSIFYYFVIFIPQKEKAKLDFERDKWSSEQKKIEDEKSKESLNTRLLNVCLQSADESYLAQWKTECESRKLKDDCSLPSATANHIESFRKESKDECFKRYPQ